ncbi:MAG: LPS assembly lipoprotein LptE [Niabella sp.]
MILKSYKKVLLASLIAALFVIAFTQSSCGIYRFKDVSIPDSVKYVLVNQFQNTATYVNPSLAPQLTDKLRQKITSQTRLTMVNNTDNAGEGLWIINCKVTSYSFATSGISNQQVNTNRLNVGVHIEIVDNKTQKIIGKYDVTSPFDYAGSLSLQQAEQSLLTQMLRDIPDAIFNRIFSNW